MSGSVRDMLVDQLARLRLACEALGIDPADVELGDLDDDDRARLRELGALDLAAITTGRRARQARESKPADDATARRQARFREIAGRARAAALRAAVREVPRGTKRDRSDQRDRSTAAPCGAQSRQHKIG